MKIAAVLLALCANLLIPAALALNPPSKTLKNDIDIIKSTPPKYEAIEKNLTGSFDITSNYIFRGISYSNNLPAFQGSFTYTFFPTGFYLSLWGSNTNLTDINDITATVEIDYYAGIKNEIGDNFSYDISIERYSYPKTDGLDYNEFIAILTYRFIVGSFGYSNNVYDSDESGTYYNLGLTFDIPPRYAFKLTGVNISGGIGHYSLPHNAGLLSYNDYNVKVTKTFNNFDFALQWSDTNGRSNDDPSLCDSKIIATLTANF